MSNKNKESLAFGDKIGFVISFLLFSLTIPIVVWMSTALTVGLSDKSGDASPFFVGLVILVGLALSLVAHVVIGNLFGNIVEVVADKIGLTKVAEEVANSEYQMGPSFRTHMGSAIFGVISVILFFMYGWDGVYALTAKVGHLFIFPVIIPLGNLSFDLGHLFSLLTGFLSILFLFLIAGISFGAVVTALIELLFFRNDKR